jgi:delta(3,5)-delta(2,4)-dienoyl-CoA isomerase
MAADLGTLQFFPNIIGNESAFREMVYTGRFIKSDEARQIGLVSKIVPNKQ